jgi:hypothetical protein
LATKAIEKIIDPTTLPEERAQRRRQLTKGPPEFREEMIAHLRMFLYRCGMAIAFICGIAALTISAAIVTNKLPDSQAWMAVVFFAAVASVAWIVGRAARSS